MISLNDYFPDFMHWEGAAAIDEIDGFPADWPGARVLVPEYEIIYHRDQLPDNAWGVNIPGGYLGHGKPAYMMIKTMLVFDETGLTLLYQYDKPAGPSVAWFGLEKSTARQRRRLDPFVGALACAAGHGNPNLIMRARDYDAAAMLIKGGVSYEEAAGRFENRAAFDIAMKRRGVRS